ncbi:hypothetical protein SELMODRAFT_432203 [Selaginella moellendorffii]|uniref:Protein kinase domain-containing protein n=1 Tax=Selaginella moellendorffii TaxID=88036 RepID=D8TFA3_SELML|nr:hypothetical protein SELMODRAFT_432203 [Selaginella moellendorffii]
MKSSLQSTSVVENDNHLTDAEAFFNRRIMEFMKKRVALMEKVLNAEYHLDDQDIPANRSNGGVQLGEGPKTSYQKPQPTFVPYPTPLTPEEVLGRALDNDPKRLKVPAYYNEVVFVSPFAKLCSMISENRLDAFQTFAGNKSTGIRLRSHSSTAVGSKLYVFGGTDGTSPLDNLFVLDTATNTWGKPDVFGDVPAPREGHSTSLIGDNLFVFGGCGKSSDPSQEEYYNDLHVLNTSNILLSFLILLSGRRFQPLESRLFLGISIPALPRRTVSLSWVARMVKQWHGRRDADKSLVSSHGGICGKPSTSPIFPCQTHATEFQAHVQPLGKKMFEARESDIFNYRYTLEASIDGKLFRGLLFSYKPGFAQAVQSYILSYSLTPGRKTSQEETTGRPKGRSKGQTEQRGRNHFTFFIIFCKHGLEKHICEKIGEEKAARIIKQLVKTFKEIYLRGVVHQDLKLDNILSKLNIHDKVVISTFRTSKGATFRIHGQHLRKEILRCKQARTNQFQTSTSLMSMAGKYFSWLPRTTAE